ncbi:MAG: 30S ribosomal protein S18 [Deltaproteobacteria bacterium]|nr:30S ribosomal protein S18 [Deltaproteobacteria bacterium]MBI3293821.1 30S ribosomal protein S18 [Deltaproteobacteria bacterium]
MEERVKDSAGQGTGGGGEKRSFQRRRGCRFCVEPDLLIDHKDQNLLASFLTERFKIIPRRISGNCASHQRGLSLAVKRARHLAVVPYSASQL